MICAFLLAASLSPAECVSLPENRTGMVEVVATDPAGELLPDAKATLRGGQELVASMNKGRLRVPYGRYRLHVEEPGFKSKQIELAVFQPELTVRVELNIGGMSCPPDPSTISGRISGIPSGSEVWVKTVPLRGTGGVETRATSRGYFLLAGLEPTDYIVLVLVNDNVLAQRVVSTLRANQKVDFDLRSTPGLMRK
jgi:hypothetical protein